MIEIADCRLQIADWRNRALRVAACCAVLYVSSLLAAAPQVMIFATYPHNIPAPELPVIRTFTVAGNGTDITIGFSVPVTSLSEFMNGWDLQGSSSTGGLAYVSGDGTDTIHFVTTHGAILTAETCDGTTYNSITELGDITDLALNALAPATAPTDFTITNNSTQ